ncbi:hypothetical protein CCR75_000246 [Bremia lactucae]|uniref:Carbohydrate kinase PfkB domain-containing protein n=1 Tax=Bremia lactucae TaxID=4779 RepID=A0A976FEK8_BRELC|nr:hypothetical protein CCR75_000246 [Bremia lactucae]
MWRRSGSALSQRLALSEEVSEALYGRVKRPLVALESTIISHGMPYPQNLHMAKRLEEIVRSEGACPATICIGDGMLKVGLAEIDLIKLAELGPSAKKCSTRDMAAAVIDKNIVGATTVSSTMRIAHAAGIKVFVTGGIGGVHRFCEETMDISTDLIELSRTPVAVVCAGIKSILDIPRTLEALETHSVPVIGYKTDQFPAFYTQDSGEKAHLRQDTPEDIARIIYESDALLLPNGHIVAVPNSMPVPSQLVNEAIELGLQEVMTKKIHGQAVTPFLLKRVNEITEGASLKSNIELVYNNAIVGSQIACALFHLANPVRMTPTVKAYSAPEKVIKISRANTGKRVLVAGGLVLDIISSSTSSLIRGTSNIGKIKQSSGGVGRNIAECLHRLELDPLLVSCVGNDAPGSILLENLKQLGMQTSGVSISETKSTAVYSAILDSSGDMDAAVADMNGFEAIEINSISDKEIEVAELVIADGNITSSAIKELFERSSNFGIDTWFEPTSVQKAVRVVEGGGLKFLKYMSPNLDELHAITEAIRNKQYNASVNSCSEPGDHFPLVKESAYFSMEIMMRLKEDLITTLLSMANGDTTRSKYILVTLGRHGALIASINLCARDLNTMVDDCKFQVEIWGQHRINNNHLISIVHHPGTQIRATNCTGAENTVDYIPAGDSMVGGTVFGLLQGHNILESCHMGMIAARTSLASEHAINPDLSPRTLLLNS